MQMAPQMGYDRAITVFSPDGRLFQVEYAREAVRRGTTAVGIKAVDGVAVLVDKRITSRLMEPESIEKIFQIDQHIGAATSGLVADARVLGLSGFDGGALQQHADVCITVTSLNRNWRSQRLKQQAHTPSSQQ